MCISQVACAACTCKKHSYDEPLLVASPTQTQEMLPGLQTQMMLPGLQTKLGAVRRGNSAKPGTRDSPCVEETAAACHPPWGDCPCHP